MRLPRRTAIVRLFGLLSWLVVAACRPDVPAPGERAALAAAVGDGLPIRARLSGGFRPSAHGVTRAAAATAPTLSPDARIAIALLEKRATADDAPAALADLGVAYLVQGDIDRAISTLEDATSQEALAPALSDLSAAYLARADRTEPRRIESLARALEAAERSLKLSRSNEALFNRSLALDELAPYTGTPGAWTEYAAAERDAAWRDAANREASNDRPIEDARDRWQSRQRELRVKLAALDAAFVRDTVQQFPEASIEFLEQEVMVDAKALAQARLLAGAIHEVTGDPMTRDEVAAIASETPAIVGAHVAYAQGLKQYDANDLSGARRSFTRSLEGFTRTRAPYRAWADMQLALIDWHEGRLEVALQTLTQVERTARARHYRTLLAGALWQRGLVQLRRWQLTEGLAAFRDSAGQFEAAGEREYAVSLYHHLADALRMLGEPTESWQFIGRTLNDLPRVRKPARRYLLLYNAALFCAREELHEAAWRFQDGAVSEAAKVGSDVLAEAIVQRALAHFRRGDLPAARADFDRASAQVAGVPAGAFHSYISAELDIVRAKVATANDSGVPSLQRAIAFFERTEPGRVPGLYLQLARAAAALPSVTSPEAALSAGINSLEKQHAELGEETLRISYFDDSWALFQDMVALKADARDRAGAFEFAERGRARSLLATAQGRRRSHTRRLAEIPALLPANVTLVHYTTLPNRILIWTITREGAAPLEHAVDQRELDRLVTRHRAAIRDGREDRAVNDRLHALLIAPVSQALAPASVIVLVPDGQLQQLPFATLRDPATRRYLIEDHALMTAPSASFFVDRGPAVAAGPATFASALLIGNPAAESMRALPGAGAEVAAAAQLYPRHEILTGDLATKQRFLASAPAYDVVHFGGHALVNPEYPLLSRLVFADEGGQEQSLFAHEVSRVRFPRTRVVVLAACSTAAGTVSRGEGVISVARPFLGAGVPAVIASQWDVDDRATEQLTMAFHRELVRSRNPAEALRTAQLHMLRSGDAVQALPRNWGAFVAVGTTGS